MLLFFGIAAAAGTTYQCLLARRAGFSFGENVLYNSASCMTTMLAFVLFAKAVDDHYTKQTRYLNSDTPGADEKMKGVDKIRTDRSFQELTIALLASHVLGLVAGSLATALFRYNPQHMGTTILMNVTSFGISTLILTASKSLEK